MLLFFAAVLIMAILSETGPREAYGNFFWQAYVCNYILFMTVAIAFVAKLLESSRQTWVNGLIVIAFGVHSLAGAAYLARIFITGSYL